MQRIPAQRQIKNSTVPQRRTAGTTLPATKITCGPSYLIPLSGRLFPPLERLGPLTLSVHLFCDQNHSRDVPCLRSPYEHERQRVSPAEELGAARGRGRDGRLEHAPPDDEGLEQGLETQRKKVCQKIHHFKRLMLDSESFCGYTERSLDKTKHRRMTRDLSRGWTKRSKEIRIMLTTGYVFSGVCRFV